MKIVVIGGSGLTGKKLIPLLQSEGHDALSASPSTGVNAVTGEGLAAAIEGADVVVDVSNSPSFADEAVMEFFTASTRHLLAAEAEAGVRHHVALSVVGADRFPDSGYMRAKVAQEELIQNGSVPFTILRATQFYEFLSAIADGSVVDGSIRLPTAPMQPLAADDVAENLAEVAVGAPVNGILEVAGPESRSMAEFIQMTLESRGDSRQVTADPDALYFGTALDERGLNPGANPRLARTTLSEWLLQHSYLT